VTFLASPVELVEFTPGKARRDGGETICPVLATAGFPSESAGQIAPRPLLAGGFIGQRGYCSARRQ